MLGWFLYLWIALSTVSLISETSHNKSSLTLMFSSLTILLKKAFSFSAISISDDVMLLLSTSVIFSFVFVYFFREKGFNYFPTFFIVINLFNAKITIMSFFGTLTSFTQRLHCSFCFHQRNNEKICFLILIKSLFLY